MHLDRELGAEMLLYCVWQKVDDCRAQFDGTREQKIAAVGLLQYEFARMCQNAGFALQRFGIQDMGPVFGPMIFEGLAQTLALDLKYLLDLADLADEEAAHFLGQHTKDKAVMLISRADERPQIGSRPHVYAVGQWNRNRNLSPQTQFPTRKKRRPAPEFWQLIGEGFLDPVEFFLQQYALTVIGNRLQDAVHEAREMGLPSATGTTVWAQLQVEADDRPIPRLDLGECAQPLGCEQLIGGVVSRRPSLARIRSRSSGV